MSKGRWRRADWSQDQINKVEALIVGAEGTNKYVTWVNHIDDIGHEISDIKIMAAKIRVRRNEARHREHNRLLRARADGEEVETPAPRGPYLTRATRSLPTMAPAARSRDADLLPLPSAARDIAVDHRIAQSTQKFLVDVELRARIAVQGVTAGLLGDPPAGRSALDKMRAGIVEPSRNSSCRNPTSPLWVSERAHLLEEVRYLEKALAE